MALTGMPMTIDHILSLASGGATIEHNLWLACRRCNNSKVLRHRPPIQKPANKYRSSTRVHSPGLTTPDGRATVLALQMNHPIIVATRRLWVSVGWWPPSD
jgi:hypothetical protein